MTLEEIIRAEAKKGQFNHLSVIYTPRGFSASYRTAVGLDGTTTATHADPVTALAQAILGHLKAKRTLTEAPPTSRADQMLE